MHSNRRLEPRTNGGYVRAIAILGLIVVAVTAFGCREQPPKSPHQAATDDYRLTIAHDDIDGDTEVAQKVFSNQEGSSARVTLTCSADAKGDIFSALAGLKDKITSDMVGGVLGMQTGCPKDTQCAVIAEIEFFNNGQPAAPTTVKVPLRLTHSVIVPYQGKNLASGAIYQATTTLMRNGSEYRSNAVQIALPTAGEALTKWLLRFRLGDFPHPIDAWINYQTPNTARLVRDCNDKLAAAEARRAAHNAPDHASPQH